MRSITPRELVSRRMQSLLLSAATTDSPVQVARWFGAMQAQDIGSGKWSLGVRIRESTQSDIDRAFQDATILRTWPMRGTIHVIPSADARWMLATTGVRALAGAESRRQFLGLDEATVNRAAEFLDGALSGRGPVTRSVALSMLTDAGIDVSGQRGYHVIWYASQLGVLCLGPQEGSEQTVVRLADWAPDQVQRDTADAMRELALRFVRSHGPVTHQDLARWAGVGAREARAAIVANDDAVEPVEADGTSMWQLRGADAGPVPDVVVLPGFDEFILGYKDRSAVLPDAHRQRIVPGNNGVFRATVVVDGQVAGTWRRTRRANADLIDIDVFETMPRRVRDRVTESFTPYSYYLGRPLTFRFS